MTPYVVIATKGRAPECCILVKYLARQSIKPKLTVFVGSTDSDLHGISETPGFEKIGGRLLLSEKASTTIQRNVGIDCVIDIADQTKPWFITFFDDDFRPADNWLEAAQTVLSNDPETSALTGQLLADGIKGPGISERKAEGLIRGEIAAETVWAQGATPRFTRSLYGCNMAVRDIVFSKVRFDERLPLYAWQEDRDFSYFAREFGNTIFHPSPVGVHLGVKVGRTSGQRMGYSQIANMVYLRQKRSISRTVCLRFVSRALLANSYRSIRNNDFIDYRGRFIGNIKAILDAVRGKMAPERILAMN